MSMRVMPIGIVNAHVGAHPLRDKVRLNVFRQQFNPCVPVQFDGQSHDKLTRKAAVLCFLVFLYGVPQLFTV